MLAGAVKTSAAARLVLSALALAASLAVHQPAAAQASQEISVLEIEIAGENSANLRAQVGFALSERLAEILRSEQPLEFVFEIRFYVERPFWVDLEYATVGWSATLVYDNILDAYRVVAFNGVETVAETIEEAMAAISDIHSLEINAERLGDRLRLSGARIQVRFEVDLEKLPPPLRVDLLSRLDWDFSTGWQEWDSAGLVRANP